LTSEEFFARMGALLSEATNLQLERSRQVMAGSAPPDEIGDSLTVAFVEHYKAAVNRHGAKDADRWFFNWSRKPAKPDLRVVKGGAS
jgi:hypothetical protein